MKAQVEALAGVAIGSDGGEDASEWKGRAGREYARGRGEGAYEQRTQDQGLDMPLFWCIDVTQRFRQGITRPLSGAFVECAGTQALVFEA